MTAREVLDQISRRAHDASLAGVGDGPLAMRHAMRHEPNRVVSPLVKDLNSTVAALRAVLDLHKPATDKRFTCEQCEYFSPCPTQRAITEALGADA